MKHHSLTHILVLLLFSPFALTGDVDLVIDEDDIFAWNSDSDTDPRGLCALSDGRLVYFEDEGGNLATDAVVLIDPSQNGVNRFSVLVDENTLEDLSPTKVYGAHVSDIVRDANDNLYLMVMGIWNSANPPRRDNYVVKVPYDANTGFGTPERIVDVFDGGKDGSHRTFHRLALSGDTLYILFDNLETSGDNLDGIKTAGDNGIYSFDLSGSTPAATSALTFLASYGDINAVLSDPAEAGDAFGMWQIRADANGNVYGFIHEHGDNRTGDLIQVTAGGVVSVFLSQEEAESETGINSIFTYETNLHIDANDHFWVMETGSGTEEREILIELDENGIFQAQHADYFQIEDNASDINSSLTTIASNAISMDDAGKVYLFFSKANNASIISVDPSVACDHNLTYTWPLENGQLPALDISTGYGPRQLDSTGMRYDFHRGIDIDMPTGTPLYAIADGVVTKAGWHTGFDEQVVAVRHGNCAPYVYSYYIHLSDVDVVIGQQVTGGVTIVGESGESFSGYEHLHIETRVGGIFQSNCRNPKEFLPYSDNAPTAGTLNAVNEANDGFVFYVEYEADELEMDLNQLDFTWGTDAVTWNWPLANLLNGPDHPEGMDRPVINFGQNVNGVAFAEDHDSSTDTAYHSFVIAGLDDGASSGTFTLTDIQGTGTDTALNLTGRSDLRIQEGQQEQTTDLDVDNVVSFDYTLENTGNASITADLSVISSANNTINLSTSQVTLAAGATQVVTVTVTLNTSHTLGVGDGFILIADPNDSTLNVAAMGSVITE